MHRLFRSCLVAASMCTALGATLGVAAPALADDRVVTGGESCVAAEAPDMRVTSTLKVKKTRPETENDVPDGSLPYGPVAGMVFTLERVKLGSGGPGDPGDYSTHAGRDGASRMTMAQAERLGFDSPASETTDATGTAVFTGITPGLYRLSETVPDDGKFNYRPSRPLLLMLPLSDPSTCQLKYDSVIVTKPKTGAPPSTPPLVPDESPTPKPRTSQPRTTAPEIPHGTPGNSATVSSAPLTSQSDQPNQPVHGGKGLLASTGANVLGAVALGLVLVVVGAVLARRGRKESQ